MMLRATMSAATLLLLAAAPLSAEVAVTVRGSPESMARQNRIARQSEAAFFRTPDDVREAIATGGLVPVEGNEDYAVNRISFPFARPETRLFLERFAAQYRAACEERLVVTSLTRPQSRQPANAHRHSVHPTGLAVDLRVSQSEACRSYLEETLLAKEREGVLDVTRERSPPHYHVAIFPEQYLAFIGEGATEEGETVVGITAPDATLAPVGHALLPAAPGPGAAEGRRWSGLIERILSLPGRLLTRFRAG
jgi:hypothetical protein